MNPQEPVIPDPDAPQQDPGAPVGDPTDPDRPTEYNASGDDGLDPYDEADADSFPASDPPAAAEPGAP
ncbi:MAG TPA: hypothetical protein VGX96_01230 [Candidatus Elarobacter sp.]|jgi:hypothetical protein|nr:hypothetical protein [Candidatus Elarobacter sp.]